MNLKQIISKIAAAAIILVGAGFLINLAIDNPYSHRLARNIINERFKAFQKLRIDFQAIDVSLFPLQASLWGFQVSPVDMPEIPLLEASNVKVRVSVPSLIWGEPRLSLVELNELKLKYPWPEALELFPANPSNDSEEAVWPPPLDLPFDELSIFNASLDFAMPNEDPSKTESPLIISLRDLNLTFDYGSWSRWDLNVNIGDTNVAVYDQLILDSGDVQFNGSFRGRGLTKGDLRIAADALSFDGGLRLDLKTRTERSEQITDRRLFKTVLETISGSVTGSVENGDFSILGKLLEINNTEGRVSGNVAAEFTVPYEAGEPVQWNVKSDARIFQGKLADFLLYDSSTSIEVTQEKISFANINLLKGEQSLGRGSGEILFDKELHYDFNVEPENLPLTDLLAAVLVPDFDVVEATINSSNIRVFGTGFPFRLGVASDANFSELKFPVLDYDRDDQTNPTCFFKVNLTITESDLNFNDTGGPCFNPTKTEDSSNVTFKGIIGFDAKKGMDLTIASSSLELGIFQFLSPIQTSGRVDLTSKIHGPYDRLKVDFDTAGEVISLADQHTSLEGKLQIDVHEDALIFDDVTLKTEGNGSISVQAGEIGLDPTLPFTGDIQIQSIRPDIFAKIVSGISGETDIPFTMGIGSLTAQIHGDLLKPLGAKGNLKASLNAGTLNNEVIFDKVDIDLESSESSVTTRNLYHRLGSLESKLDLTVKRNTRLRNQGDSTLTTKLGLNAGDNIELKIKTMESTGESVDHFKTLPFVGRYLSPGIVEGQIEFRAHLAGTPEKLAGEFEGGMRNPRVLGTQLAHVNFKGTIDGGDLKIPSISQPGQTLVGQMNIKLFQENLPYDWSFRFNNFDFRFLLPSDILRSDPRNYAYLSGDWQMEGTLLNWWGSRGKFDLSGINGKISRQANGETAPPFMLRSEEPTTIVINEDGWNIEGKPLTLRIAGNVVNLTADSNKLPDAMDMKVNGIFNVSSLKTFVPAIQSAQGKVIVDGAIQGSVTDPDLSFSLKDVEASPYDPEKKPINISFQEFNPPLTDIDIDISMHGGKLDINRLRASKGAGTIDISGQVDMRGSDPESSRIFISINQAEIQRFPISIFKSVDTTLNADLVLIGNALPLKLSGNVNVLETESTGSFDIRQQIIDAIRKGKIKSGRTAEREYLILDLQISSNNSVAIKSRNLEAILGGDLYLSGSLENPVLMGQITVPSGNFTYKREFEITSGTILFDQPISPPDPKLNIIGEARVSRYTVQFAVTGYASQPKVDFSIEPSTRADGTPISKLEILMLLSSGNLPDNNNVGLSQSVAYNEALSIVIGQFEEPIEKLIEMSGQSVIRQVYLDTYTSETSNSPVARLNLPINLRDDVNLIFQVDSDSNMKISSEYALHDSISVSGGIDKKNENEEQTTKGKETDTGVDLRFKFSFP
jgi:hypothetical protein